MLKTKSIIAPIEPSDGIRISVMSRHTLNDGITPHPKINAENYGTWDKALAPPETLIGDYYKRKLPWEQFEIKYQEYIRQPNLKTQVQDLAQRSLETNITILCIEDSPEHCHRKLLAKECQKYYPELILEIK
jgi:uncharacterized protein YeaO (DUF488 family)